MLQMDLISNQEPNKIELLEADLLLWQYFYPQNVAQDYLEQLSKKLLWQSETLFIANQERLVPRLIAWYGDAEAHYRYSGVEHQPLPWNKQLFQIKKYVEQKTGFLFNSVLANLYRNGQDSVGWHCDDEPELGDEPVIASLSFGASRRFLLKHKKQKDLKHTIDLTSGSLLLMKGKTQQSWLHQIPKQQNIAEPRINLTFRLIKQLKL